MLCMLGEDHRSWLARSWLLQLTAYKMSLTLPQFGTIQHRHLSWPRPAQVLAVQQVASPPESCLFLDSPAMGASGTEEGAGAGALFLHVGELCQQQILKSQCFNASLLLARCTHSCQLAPYLGASVSGSPAVCLTEAVAAGLANGVLLRTEVDHVTGQLSDTRTRFLGTRPPKLLATAVNGRRSMLALSSRAWLGYSDQGRYNLSPLSFEALDHASSASDPSLFFLTAINFFTML